MHCSTNGMFWSVTDFSAISASAGVILSSKVTSSNFLPRAPPRSLVLFSAYVSIFSQASPLAAKAPENGAIKPILMVCSALDAAAPSTRLAIRTQEAKALDMFFISPPSSYVTPCTGRRVCRRDRSRSGPAVKCTALGPWHLQLAIPPLTRQKSGLTVSFETTVQVPTKSAALCPNAVSGAIASAEPTNASTIPKLHLRFIVSPYPVDARKPAWADVTPPETWTPISIDRRSYQSPPWRKVRSFHPLLRQLRPRRSSDRQP